MSSKVQQPLLAAATALAALSFASESAFAEQPEPTVRTFGFFVGNAQEIPDFTSDDSIAVTSLPLVVDGGSMWFPPLTDFPSDDHDLEATEWVSHPAHHAVKGGQPPAGIYFWQQTEATPEPPPVGAHTFTGPEGLIFFSQVLYLRPCVSADEGVIGDEGARCHYGDAAAGKYLLSSTPDGNANAFVVVTAVFSK